MSIQRVPAVGRAAAVLRHISRTGRPVSLAALTRDLALPRSSAARICDALVDDRVLVRLDDGRLWLGPHLIELAAASGATLERDLSIGLLIASRANAFYTTMLGAAERDLDSGGRLLVRDAHEDPATQRAQWHELLDGGADVVLVDAVDAAAHAPELEHARQAGVPIVAIGSRLDGVHASVTSDNTHAGLLGGHHLASRLGGRGRIAILDGLDKNANIDRVAGFREAIRDEPELVVTAHERDDHDTAEAGRRMMARALGSGERFDAVFAVCDPIALGAAEVLGEHDLEIPIVSVDGRREAAESIASGGPIVATAAQDPAKIVLEAIAIARDLARGRPPVQGAHLIPVRLIDAGNVRGYEAWG